jgi:tetratricopeptide (TPR) repeat protein
MSDILRNKIITVFFLLLSSPAVFADNKSDIYSAYINNRMDIWKSIIDKMESSAPKDNEFILELTDYQYGYVGYCIGFDKDDEARKYLTLAEKNIDELEKAGYKLSVINAYKSAFYGFRIALNKLSAPFNGPKSLSYAKKAIAIDSANYSGYVQYGNAHFYMPAAFGGSKQVAFENFDKARKLMEGDPALTKNNWNYISLLVTIAQSYTYLDEYEKAKNEYENILRIEPGFLYVRDELYPKLLSKMKK